MTHDPLDRYMNQRSAQIERRIRLRPMGVNELLDVSLRAYQLLGRPLLGAVALPSVMCLAGFMFFWSYAFPAFWSTSNASNINLQLGEAVLAIGLSLAVAGPLFLLGVAYSTIVTTQMMSDFMVGNVPNVEGAKRLARRNTAKMVRLLLREMVTACLFLLVSVGLLILSTLLTVSSNSVAPAGISALAILAMIVGGLWVPFVLARDALAPAAMLIEGHQPKSASRRSRELLKGSARVISGYQVILNVLLLIGLLWLLIGWGLAALNSEAGIGDFAANLFSGTVLQDLVATAFAYFPWFLVIWVTIPIWSTTVTILYYERRVRLEGYDIEILARDVWSSDQSRRFQL